jgi:hypothetical protein
MNRRTLVTAASAATLVHVLPMASEASAAEPVPTPLEDLPEPLRSQFRHFAQTATRAEKQAFGDVLMALLTSTPSQREAALDGLAWVEDRYADGTIPAGMTASEAIDAGHITVTRRDGCVWYQAA